MYQLSESEATQLIDGFKELRKQYGNTADSFKRTDEAIAELQAKYKDVVTARLDAMEQLVKQHPSAGGGEMFTAAAALMANAGLQGRPAAAKLGRGSYTVEVFTKDILNVSTQFPVPTTLVASSGRLELAARRFFPVTPTTGGAVEWIKETGLTNNAAPVAEGQPKPKSDISYEVEVTVLRTIAHYTKISRQCYDDLPQLAAELSSRLIYMLLVKEEAQLIKGDGTGINLQGIYPVATPLTAAPPADATLYDKVLLGVAQLAAAGYTATGAIVNAADLTAVAMLKDSTKQYIAKPEYQLPPIATSPTLAPGEWIVGAFPEGARIYQRDTANVMIATQNEDDFTRNMLTALAELREALVVYQPAAFVKNAAA